MPISFNGTTGAVTGIVSASSSDLSTSFSSKVSTTGQTGTVNLSTATLTGAGMDLITSQTFSSASSVNVNNCFTSTHENYRIIFSGFSQSTLTSISLRLRASGTDNSASNFKWGGIYRLFTSSGGDDTTNGASSWTVGLPNTTTVVASTLDVCSPALPVYTSMIGQRSNYDAAAFNNGFWAANDVFDGFTVFVSSGTFSGRLRVYGYRNTP
jgi:hypothetical protein